MVGGEREREKEKHVIVGMRFNYVFFFFYHIPHFHSSKNSGPTHNLRGFTFFEMIEG